MIDALLGRDAHQLSRNRRACGRLRAGPRRHRPYAGGGPRPGRRDREAETVSRGACRAGSRLQRATSWWCCRTAIQTCWRRRVRITASRSMRMISVAAAGAFKPHVATYHKAAELIGAAREEVLFVANHAFDCIGAKAAGMRTAFIDRRRRPFGATPLPARPDRAQHDRSGRDDRLIAPDIARGEATKGRSDPLSLRVDHRPRPTRDWMTRRSQGEKPPPPLVGGGGGVEQRASFDPSPQPPPQGEGETLFLASSRRSSQ